MLDRQKPQGQAPPAPKANQRRTEEDYIRTREFLQPRLGPTQESNSPETTKKP